MIEDARTAGYDIREYGMCVDIVKYSKHSKPRPICGLRIWQDGAAIDVMLDLSVAKAIRTVKAQRAFLGI
jgi:hypothetical protein